MLNLNDSDLLFAFISCDEAKQMMDPVMPVDDMKETPEPTPAVETPDPPPVVETPVTGLQESIIATTTNPLTEVTLHESVVTITLNNRRFASSIFDIRDAVSVSGIDGVTIPWHEPERESDTYAIDI